MGRKFNSINVILFVQTALERHVNSHIATNGTTNGAQANSTLANKKLDGSPAKASRRKKLRLRKQRINIGMPN